MTRHQASTSSRVSTRVGSAILSFLDALERPTNRRAWTVMYWENVSFGSRGGVNGKLSQILRQTSLATFRVNQRPLALWIHGWNIPRTSFFFKEPRGQRSPLLSIFSWSKQGNTHSTTWLAFLFRSKHCFAATPWPQGLRFPMAAQDYLDSRQGQIWRKKLLGVLKFKICCCLIPLKKHTLNRSNRIEISFPIWWFSLYMKQPVSLHTSKGKSQ